MNTHFPCKRISEDGYELWLRYVPAAHPALTEYRAALTYIVVEGTSATLQTARDELAFALPCLLGTSVPLAGTAGRGALVAGTPHSSPLIAALDLGADLARARDEGFPPAVRAARFTAALSAADPGWL